MDTRKLFIVLLPLLMAVAGGALVYFWEEARIGRLQNEIADLEEELDTLLAEQLDEEEEELAVDFCNDVPETNDIGMKSYPIDPQYAHLSFLGQIFTAADCSPERLAELPEVEDGNYTYGMGLGLRTPPSPGFLEVLQELGFTCSGVGSDDCISWELKSVIPVEDVLRLKPYRNNIEYDDCRMCG